MVTENGIVVDANPLEATISASRSGACKSCSSRDTCGISDNGGKEVIVTVKNILNVKKGDHVVLGMKSSPFLIIAFLLYVFPVICMIIGALIANELALSFGWTPGIFSVLSGAAFLILSYAVIRMKSKTLSGKDAYKPFLVRKKMIIASGTDN